MVNPKPEVKINNPNPGKVKIIVSGSVVVKSTDPRVVIERKG